MKRLPKLLLLGCLFSSLFAGFFLHACSGNSSPQPAQADPYSWVFVQNGTKLTYIYTLAGQDYEIQYEVRNLSTQTGLASWYDDDSKALGPTGAVLPIETNLANNATATAYQVTLGALDDEENPQTVDIYNKTSGDLVYGYSKVYGIAVKIYYSWAVLTLKDFPWVVHESSDDIPGPPVYLVGLVMLLGVSFLAFKTKQRV